jgi:hypothetical protein
MWVVGSCWRRMEPHQNWGVLHGILDFFFHILPQNTLISSSLLGSEQP